MKTVFLASLGLAVSAWFASSEAPSVVGTWRLVSFESRDGTDREVRDAFEGYHAYFGRYSVDEKAHTVTHEIAGASFPNLVGTKQVRVFSVVGDRLTLSTPPIAVGGRAVSSTLTWERMGRGSEQ